jgi:hypothetical protein
MSDQQPDDTEHGFLPTTHMAIPREGTFLNLQHPGDPTQKAVLFIRPSQYNQHPLGFIVLLFASPPMLPLNVEDARGKAIMDILLQRVYMYEGDDDREQDHDTLLRSEDPAAFFIEVRSTHLYALPIGPKDLAKTPPPDFGQAILVDRADLSSREQAVYEQGGILPLPGYHLRFTDAASKTVQAVFRTHLDEIGAWRNRDGMWDAYTTWLPEDQGAMPSKN